MNSTSYWRHPSSAESTVRGGLDNTLFLSARVTHKSLTRLLHMNLSSIRGFQEIAYLAADIELEEHARQVARRRLRHCRELVHLGRGRLAFRPISLDPAAMELRRMWIMARTSLLRDRGLRALEQAGLAELVLEHAYRAAASTERNQLAAILFAEHARQVGDDRRQFAEHRLHAD